MPKICEKIELSKEELLVMLKTIEAEKISINKFIKRAVRTFIHNM
jgi:hypothetical protein